jgi:surface carbohydrate biosynthesis protein
VISKLKRIYLLIIRTKFLLLNSTPCDVLILDDSSAELMLACIPQKLKVQVLSLDNKLPIIFSVAYFWFFLRYVFESKFLTAIPILATIRIWEPKVIITYIDNSPIIGRIKQYLPHILGISVQNGFRFDLANPEVKPFVLDQYYCFGEVENSILIKGGHKANHSYPLGSLKSGIYLKQSNETVKKKFDICFLSQFTSMTKDLTDEWTRQRVEAYHETGKSLFNTVVEYTVNNGLQLCVAMRFPEDHPNYNEECIFYSNPKLSNVHHNPNNYFSSYEIANNSTLIISISSTLGYEMFGMGSRVIFGKDIEKVATLVLNGLWDNNLCTHKLPELMRLHTEKIDELSLKATTLINMPEEEYIKYSEEARLYYMNLDKSNLPHNIIKKRIQTIFTEVN